MPIAGGLDIHRKQLTFDYLDTVTGEVKRGQIAPADRVRLRAWLAPFAGRDGVAFAVEGRTGGRDAAEELAAARSRGGPAHRPGGQRKGAAARAAGCRPAPDRSQGPRRPAVWCRPGHRAGDDLLAGRGWPVLLLPQGGPVRRAGHHRLLLRRQTLPRPPVPPGPAGAALGGV